MNKKIEEIAESVKSEVCKSNITTTKQEQEAIIKEIEILQPSIIPCASTPLIIQRDNEVFFTFDGRSLFFDMTYDKSYVFLPYPIKNGCFYKLKKFFFSEKSKDTKNNDVFVMLDNQNKLQYCQYKNYIFNENRVTISRNVIQMVQYHNDIYYLSFKKDAFFLNVVCEDVDGLKPKIMIHNLTSKFGMQIFCANKSCYLFHDKSLISSSGKKLNIKGEGIYDIGDYLLIHTNAPNSLVLSICDKNFNLKNELHIDGIFYNVKIKQCLDLIFCQAGKKLYVIELVEEQLKICKEICMDKVLDFCPLFIDKKIVLYKLLHSADKKDNTKEIGFITQNHHIALPIADVNSKVYDPVVANDDIENIVSKLFERFEKKLEENNLNERERQLNLLDKVSDTLNTTLSGVLETLLRSELAIMEQNLIKTFSSKLAAYNKKSFDEDKALESIKEVICETILPVVEASMDELRIQMVAEAASFHKDGYLKDVKNALEEMKLKERKTTIIEDLIKTNSIAKAIELASKNPEQHMQDLLLHLDPVMLENISSEILVAFLGKCVMLINERYVAELDTMIYHTLINIDLEMLRLDMLKLLGIIISQISDSTVIEKQCTRSIIVLTGFLRHKIPKIVNKKSLSK